MGGGTEAFPDLGQHCQEADCNQLDFLPFICDGCRKVFCLDHRAYKSHGCPRAEHNSRVVVVCEACSVSIEKKADEEAAAVLEKHARSGDCDPSKKNKPKCPVRRCKEQLTFSNCTTCKTCSQKLCLKHRFPSDHNCKSALRKNSNSPVSLTVSLTGRIGTDRRDNKPRMPSPPSIEAY